MNQSEGTASPSSSSALTKSTSSSYSNESHLVQTVQLAMKRAALANYKQIYNKLIEVDGLETDNDDMQSKYQLINSFSCGAGYFICRRTFRKSVI